MPVLRRFLFVGCCLFVASFSFGTGFLGNLAYLTAVSPDPNHSFSQMEMMNAVIFGLGAAVLTARSACVISRSILQSRLQTLTIFLALAGYAGTAVLLGGLLSYIFTPYL